MKQVVLLGCLYPHQKKAIDEQKFMFIECRKNLLQFLQKIEVNFFKLFNDNNHFQL
jgi:hypothetical protein